MRNEEHYLQTACVNWFRLAYPQYAWMLFAVPNGGSRTASQAKSLKAEGVIAGVSDLILLMPRQCYGSLCIEMKTQKGKQEPEQKVWQLEVEKFGNKYVVVRSFDQFRSEVSSYLGEEDDSNIEGQRKHLKELIKDR